MPPSATLAHQKTPCSRVCAPRVAARPGRGGASGASFMPDSKTTGDRYAIDQFVDYFVKQTVGNFMKETFPMKFNSPMHDDTDPDQSDPPQ